MYAKGSAFTQFEPKVATLLSGMLTVNPSRRITVK